MGRGRTIGSAIHGDMQDSAWSGTSKHADQYSQSGIDILEARTVERGRTVKHITLPASKTDPFRQGVTLTIAATGDEACAVSALQRLFHDWPASLSAPLFQIGGSFTRQRLTETLRETLMTVGIHGHYTGHSFRRGAATSAREAGLSEDEIQLLGRWKSDSYRLYIVTHPARILAASRRHQHLPQR